MGIVAIIMTREQTWGVRRQNQVLELQSTTNQSELLTKQIS